MLRMYPLIQLCGMIEIDKAIVSRGYEHDWNINLMNFLQQL